MADHPENDGGSGDDSAPTIRDTRMLARAVLGRWPMSDKVRVTVLKRLCKIVDEDAWETEEPRRRPKTREVIAASRALLAADKLNLDQERLNLQRPAEDDTPKARDVVAEMKAAAARYEQSEGRGDPGGAAGLQAEPGPVQ